MLKEITVLGRGGQGGVTGAEILAEAAFFSRNYNYVSSFPTFGTERRGAPVQAFTRISDKKIWTRQHIYNPDIAIVLDETILTGAFLKSIKKGGLLIVNTDKSVADFIKEYGISDDITVVTSNITHLCIKENLIVDGTPMVSTPRLGVVGAVLK
ncbi:MAG: 2-oxoacid:acceptor oxidoreductase family protein [Promethearchaeota archaeon]